MLYGIHRHGNVHVVMAGLYVVEPQAVQHDEGLAEARPADGQIVLHAAGSARQAVDEEARVAHRQQADGAIDFVERERLIGAGYDDGFMRRRRLLGLGQTNGKWQQKEYFGVQFLL